MLNRTGVGVVVVAAGSSTRMEGVDKTFAPLLGRPLITHTLDRLEEYSEVYEIVLVLAAGSLEYGRSLVHERGYRKVSHICGGGARRQDSVKAGLSALAPCRWVMVHDGARPGLDLALLQRGMGAVTASTHGAAIARRARQGHHQSSRCGGHGHGHPGPRDPLGRPDSPDSSTTNCFAAPMRNLRETPPTMR